MSSSNGKSETSDTTRKIIVVRHGERVDFTFQDTDWVSACFKDGKYIKKNLNMPDTVPSRIGWPQDFKKDTPLTQVGNLQGYTLGKGLKSAINEPKNNSQEANFLKDSENLQVYSSPALRSVETTREILRGLGSNAKIKLEPSLFEWTGWYADQTPIWLTKKEFIENGFNIDENYQPFMAEIPPNESIDTFYKRSEDLMNNILQNNSKETNFLIVGHGASLDVLSRPLLKKPNRTYDEMLRLVIRVIPYCGICIVEEVNDTWRFVPSENFNLLMRHSSVNDYEAPKMLK